MSKAGFAVQIFLLFLSDLVDAVAAKFPLDILSSSFPGAEVVKVANKDIVTTPSSGMTVALVQKAQMSADTASNQGGKQADAATLENMAMSMAAMGDALANTPELAAGMNSIEQIVNDTLANLFTKYWHDVGREPQLYQQWQTSTEACNYTRHHDSIPVLADRHLNCRVVQSQLQTLLDSTTSCSLDYQTTYAGLRHARCDNFWKVVNVFPRSHLPDACKRVPGEINDVYVSRVVDDFSGLQTAWNESFIECQRIIDEFTNATNYCSNLTEALSNKTAECDAIQLELDATSCNIVQGEEAVTCTEYDQCWKNANDTYIRENATIAQTENDVEGEIRAMKRVRCICRALQLPQGDIDEALGVCQNTTFSLDECYQNLSSPTNWTCSTIGPPISYSFYLVDWNPPNTPTLPAANCSGGVERPCTAAYVNDYFSNLPFNAPAAPSTVDCCTMCGFFDQCGVNLTRPHAELIRGFDEATCCLKAKWVVGLWSPTLFGEDCPTGCGHPAADYTRNITCVNELGSPAPESECARLHGAKNATALSCSATANCTACTTCSWGYERQGCNPSAGEYGRCVRCQKLMGHYFATEGSCQQQQCTLCATTGQYLAGCQYSFGNPGTCTPCTEVMGTYFTGAGAYVDFSCPTSNCTVCRNGEYTAACSGSFSGTCDACVGANNSGIVGYQQYYSGPGTVVNDSSSCPISLCDYSRCPFGSVLANCGGGNPGTCVPCQPVCSLSNSSASCPASCHWNTDTSVCEATSYVVPGALGQCRFAPCEPRICANGQYLAGCGGIRPGTCTACDAAPAGQFFVSPGRYIPQCPSVECQNCSVGMYRQNCSGANGGTCVECSAPTTGNYFTSHGGLTDSCPNEPCDGSRCKAGHYLHGCGGRDNGDCKACTNHVEGYYFSSHGNLTDYCPHKACNASTCEIGFYLRNCGGHLSPAKNGTCSPCSAPPENYYWVTNGGTHNHCKAKRCYDLPACPNGHYRKGCGGKNNATGIGQCVPCNNIAPGLHYHVGPGNASGFCEARSCDALPNCDPGHMRVNCGSPDDPGSTGNCTTFCPAPADGYYYFEGCVPKACGVCGAAQYRDGCGNDTSHTSPGICKDCPSTPEGKFYNTTVVAGCTPQDCETVTQCGVGQYRSGCGNTSAGICAACSQPPPGYFISGRGSLTADSCPVTSCNELDPCAPGQYRKDCGIATAPQSAGHCEPCDAPPFGQYYSGPGDIADNASSCPTKNCLDEAACLPGQFRDGCGMDVNVAYNNIGVCRRCSDPPAGFYYVGDGGINDSCTTASCLHAPQCQTGYFRQDCGGHNKPTGYGTCVQCTPPAADLYFVTHGFLNDSCKTESCVTAGDCNVGEFRTDCGGENHPTSVGYCTNCTANLLPGNVWLTDGDLSDECTQGQPSASTATS